MSDIKFAVELTVATSQLEAFKQIAKEMNAIVLCNEPDTISCKWFHHKEDNKWYLTEKFKDSDAFLKHLDDVSSQLDKLLEISEINRFEVFGDMAFAAKAAIVSFGAKHYSFWSGVSH